MKASSLDFYATMRSLYRQKRKKISVETLKMTPLLLMLCRLKVIANLATEET